MKARVLVTRARNDALSGLLRAEGLEPVEVPLIGFEATGASLPEAEDWVLLTSATVIPYLEALQPGWLARVPRLAVVGPATAAAARAVGGQPVAMPAEALGVRVVAELGELRGRAVLYPRAEQVSPELEEALVAAGARVRSVSIYRTICPPEAAAELAAALPVDLITLASGSAARHLVGTGVPLGDARVLAIGPSTAREARALGLAVAGVADPHTAEGLATLAARFSRRGGSSGPS